VLTDYPRHLFLTFPLYSTDDQARKPFWPTQFFFSHLDIISYPLFALVVSSHTPPYQTVIHPRGESVPPTFLSSSSLGPRKVQLFIIFSPVESSSRRFLLFLEVLPHTDIRLFPGHSSPVVRAATSALRSFAGRVTAPSFREGKFSSKGSFSRSCDYDKG